MTRWLFADQLGPAFLEDVAPDEPVLLVEARSVFARRRFHRQKAHLVLSAQRHLARELGDRAVLVQAGTYREALDGLPRSLSDDVSVCAPTSWAADRLVRRLADEGRVRVLPPRGFASTRDEFRQWADGRGNRRLLMEDFYRDARRRLGLLLDGEEPVGGRWNLDAENRQPPPKGARTLPLPEPWWPQEDDVDEQVRADLDRWEREGHASFVGVDGPRRFAATRAEALAALERFVTDRLPTFGPYEDAMLAADWSMSHSLLSAPMNLGLLHPVECAERAEAAYRAGDAPLASVEGYVRQLVGWRDYVWHLYWYLGEDYRRRNALEATAPLPRWFAELDADAVQARCLSTVLRDLRDTGWVHHIPRLMVLGNWALQRGYDPQAVTDWFHRCFVDGYDWVMVPNVVGMSQHADGGTMATKPYAAGGSYINRMSDLCRGCAYSPTVRVGERACPFTAGYWAFLDRHRGSFERNHRMVQAVRGLDRLRDLDALREQERTRGDDAP